MTKSPSSDFNSIILKSPQQVSAEQRIKFDLELA